ncbi:phenylacetate--CoA ligase family protein [Dongshaea marina]|uniref:phenylacetate--CoA ligase family protein n=1 Tax=Dongshaea marina TaxID=2047966 RepID=UPI000D3ED823|nr:AMP-binding protein [Dongshaea marina]
MEFKLLKNHHTATREEHQDYSDTLFHLTISQLMNHPYYSNVLTGFPAGQHHFNDDTPILTGIKLAQLTKDNPLSMIDDPSGIGITICSGGSTGKRKAITHSRDFFQRMIDLGVRAVQASSIETPKAVANCFMAGDMSGAFTFGEGICDKLGVHYFPVGSKIDPLSLGEIIEDFKIDTLFCTPSFAYSLAHRASNLASFSSLKSIYYVGELMTNRDAEYIQSRLNVAIRSLSYTTSELGPIGYQCQGCAHDTYHINHDAVHIEIIDPTSHKILPDGHKGEVLVTTYLNDGTPFLRYNTGDLGMIHQSCNCCERQSKTIQLFGRTKGSTKVCAFTLEKSLVLDVVSEIVPATDNDIQVVIRGNKVDLKLQILLDSDKFSSQELTLIENKLTDNYIFKRIISQSEVLDFCVTRKHRSDFNKSRMHKTPFFIHS